MAWRPGGVVGLLLSIRVFYCVRELGNRILLLPFSAPAEQVAADIVKFLHSVSGQQDDIDELATMACDLSSDPDQTDLPSPFKLS